MIPVTARGQRLSIGVDALSAWGSGSARFLQELLPYAGTARPGWRWIVFVGPRTSLRLDGNQWEMRPVRGSGIVPLRVAFETLVLPSSARKIGLDALVSPADVGPVRRTVPTLLFCRNPRVVPPACSSIRAPEAGNARLRAQRVLLARSASQARFVVTFTEAMRAGVVATLGVSSDRVRVLRPGADHVAHRMPIDLGYPFVLTVGYPYPHKNLGRMIEAWKLIRNGQGIPHRLVIVGATAKDLAPYSSQELADLGVVPLGPVPPSAVGGYYWGASAFVLPSSLESYGHPIAEAVATGLPVACSDAAVMRETAGPGAIFFDPSSPDDIAVAIREALSRTRLPPHARRVPLWKDCAEKFCALIEEAVG